MRGGGYMWPLLRLPIWHTNVSLTHCGLVTPYGGRDLGQHWCSKWLVAWRHQPITWTNVDLSSIRSHYVHLRAISLVISQPSVTKISLKIIFLRFYWNLPRANKLNWNLQHIGCWWVKSTDTRSSGKWQQFEKWNETSVYQSQ